jgi:hypothetical protein
VVKLKGNNKNLSTSTGTQHLFGFSFRLLRGPQAKKLFHGEN